MASVRAQAASDCPVITVFGPSGVVRAGEIARYSVQVDPIDSAGKLTYKWSSSLGVIKSGQGTPAIDVVQPQKHCVTVTVEIGGLSENCPASFSESSCGQPQPLVEKLFEISGILTSEYVARIEEVLDEYHDKPIVQFYFIVSGTDQIDSRDRKLTALKSTFKSDPYRATYVISDKTDDKVIMWAVPPGADRPKP